MEKTTFFEKANSLKEKFFSFFQHKKKVRALDNYALCAPFYHQDYLGLIRKCMSQAFLDRQEADFLDHLLAKYEISYLDWAHRTRWLKAQMQELSDQRQRVPEPQIQFNFDKRPNTPVHVPIEILMPQKGYRPIRRV
jgi:hypothetical protein